MTSELPPVPPRSVWWGWGAADADRSLSGAGLALLGRELGRPVDAVDEPPVDLPAVRLPERPLAPSARAALAAVVGEEHVRTDAEARVEHAGGKSYRDLVRARGGDADEAPDAVVLPADADQVAQVLRVCAEHDLAVVPFGGGTSVVGGVQALRGDHAGVVTLDLRRLDGLVDLDPVSRTATFGAGVRGPEAERLLAAHDLTLGHFPQSFEQATLGGFAATRSSGQASSGYGRFDDMVLAATVVTPEGELRVGGFPGTAAGPALLDLVLGSEGRLGVITDVTVRARPRPAATRHEAWAFASFEEATAALRQLAQSRTLPDVCRASDAEETRVTLRMAGRSGAALRGLTRLRRLGDPCLVILLWDGPDSKTVDARAAAARPALTAHHGRRLPGAVARAWAAHRFGAPYLRDELLRRGVLVETLETATGWSNLVPLAAAVRTAISDAFVADGTRCVVQTHVSHVYETGASLYLTVIGEAGDDPLGRWGRAKEAASRAIVEHGGTITHHHAVGVDHRAYLPDEVGELGIRLLRAAAGAVDPQAVMNPGKLFS